MTQTINPVFSYYTSEDEQSLIEDIIIESIQITGLDILYIPREYVNLDLYYGEDVLSSFSEYYQIEAYPKTITSYDGQRDFMSKFGIQIRNEITFNFSIKRFDELVTQPHLISSGKNIIRPREGDLVYFPVDKRVFEIAAVEKRSVFFQIGQLYIYEINCKQFEISGERFQTGIDDIDRIEDSTNYEIKITLDSGVGNYLIGETVVAGTFSGIVTEWDDTIQQLSIMRTKGELDMTETIQGELSAALYSILPATGVKKNTNEPIVDNDKSQNSHFVIDTQNPLSM